MTRDIICRYVPYADVLEWTALGWEPDGSGPLHAPHGFHSVLMTWMGKGEPIEPAKREIDEGAIETHNVDKPKLLPVNGPGAVGHVSSTHDATIATLSAALIEARGKVDELEALREQQAAAFVKFAKDQPVAPHPVDQMENLRRAMTTDIEIEKLEAERDSLRSKLAEAERERDEAKNNILAWSDAHADMEASRDAALSELAKLRAACFFAYPAQTNASASQSKPVMGSRLISGRCLAATKG
jgi:hypothetical protein